MEKIELRPCPFCGRDDSISIDKYQCSGEWWHFAECEECMAKGPVGKTEQDAADAWNERTIGRVESEDEGKCIDLEPWECGKDGK